MNVESVGDVDGDDDESPGWFEKMRCRRRARVVLPLEEGPERAMMDVLGLLGVSAMLFIPNPIYKYR